MDRKLIIYRHKVEFQEGKEPTVDKKVGEVFLEPHELLEAECRHFLDCLTDQTEPEPTDGSVC